MPSQQLYRILKFHFNVKHEYIFFKILINFVFSDECLNSENETAFMYYFLHTNSAHLKQRCLKRNEQFCLTFKP